MRRNHFDKTVKGMLRDFHRYHADVRRLSEREIFELLGQLMIQAARNLPDYGVPLVATREAET